MYKKITILLPELYGDKINDLYTEFVKDLIKTYGGCTITENKSVVGGWLNDKKEIVGDELIKLEVVIEENKETEVWKKLNLLLKDINNTVLNKNKKQECIYSDSINCGLLLIHETYNIEDKENN